MLKKFSFFSILCFQFLLTFGVQKNTKIPYFLKKDTKKVAKIPASQPQPQPKSQEARIKALEARLKVLESKNSSNSYTWADLAQSAKDAK